MDSVPRTSGIYQIRCIPTGKIYIGSAVNIRERWRKHRESLLRNGHDNSYLQHAWNKYGAEAFEFTVIELVLAPFLLEREQYWLDKRKPYIRSKGFNFSPTAGSTYGLKMNIAQREAIAAGIRGRKHTPETKAKIAAGRLGKRHSDETKQSISRFNKGRKHAPEVGQRHSVVVSGEGNGRAKLNWNQVRAIRVRHAAGGISLAALAAEYGVTPTTISCIVRGEIWKER